MIFIKKIKNNYIINNKSESTQSYKRVKINDYNLVNE